MNNTYELLLESSNEASFIEYENNGKLLNSVSMVMLNKSIDKTFSEAAFYAHESKNYANFYDCFEDGEDNAEKKKNIFKRMWEAIKNFFKKMFGFMSGNKQKNKIVEAVTKKTLADMKKKRDKLRKYTVKVGSGEGENEENVIYVSETDIANAYDELSKAKNIGYKLVNKNIIREIAALNRETINVMIYVKNNLSQEIKTGGFVKNAAHSAVSAIGMAPVKVNKLGERWDAIIKAIEEMISKKQKERVMETNPAGALKNLNTAPESFEKVFSSGVKQLVSLQENIAEDLKVRINEIDSLMQKRIASLGKIPNKAEQSMKKTMDTIRQIGQDALTMFTLSKRLLDTYSSSVHKVNAFFLKIELPKEENDKEE